MWSAAKRYFIILQAALAEALRHFVHYKVGTGAGAARTDMPHNLGGSSQTVLSSSGRPAPPAGQASHLAQPSRAAPMGAVSSQGTESSEASSDASSSLSTPAGAAADSAPAAARQGASATGAPKQAPAAAAARQPAAGKRDAGSAAAPQGLGLLKSRKAPEATGPGAGANPSEDGTSSGSYETDGDVEP